MDLSRLLAAKSIAVYGGAWAENVIEQLQRSGYEGAVWPVHPKRSEILGEPTYANTASLPAIPDAAFIGVNRERTIDIVSELREIGAGGAICFASGFREVHLTQESLSSADFKERSRNDLQAQLVEAAGSMPVLGPNCYGMINYVDNVCIWPDQHGGQAVSQGVAIVAQSSNIAINMTMQRRGLSLSHMITVGNQAIVSVCEIAEHLIQDDRVTVIGLYLEGFGDLRAFETMARKAHAAGKPIVALKIGKSDQARAATLSHTASLAGSEQASSAFLKRLGIVETDSIANFLETLKVLDVIGPIGGRKITSVSCSGGEASLMADLCKDLPVEFCELSASQKSRLEAALGDKVDIANPLDYHTYIWGDVPVMTACFEAVVQGDADVNLFVLDIPRADRCDIKGHECAIEAIIKAAKTAAGPVAVIATLEENLDENVTQRFLDGGVIPLHGMQNGLAAIERAMRSSELLGDEVKTSWALIKPSSAMGRENQSITLAEDHAKAELAKFGLDIPRSCRIENERVIPASTSELNFPMVLKGLGIAHKTEANAVVLGIKTEAQLTEALASMPSEISSFMAEEMVEGCIAELLVGVTFDATGLGLLTIGAGGIYTELLKETVSLSLPASRSEIEQALEELKICKILRGFRGKAGVNWEAMLDAIMAVAQYAQAKVEALIELDINPLILTADCAVAADALIRLSAITNE